MYCNAGKLEWYKAKLDEPALFDLWFPQDDTVMVVVRDTSSLYFIVLITKNCKRDGKRHKCSIENKQKCVI